MKSSSDRGGWAPLALSCIEPGNESGIVAATAPALALVPPAGDGSWLPMLGTTEQDVAVARLEEAYQRGRADERVRADARCRMALQAVAKSAAHLESIAAEFARDRECDLQAVALAVARSMVRRELTLSPEIVGELITRAIELMPLDHELEVRLNPADLQILGTAVDSLVPAGRTVRLQWIGDANVESGGFLLESPARIVDGRTDVALRVLYERFDHD